MPTYRSMTVTIGAISIEALAAEAASAPNLRPTSVAFQLVTRFAWTLLGDGVRTGSTAELEVGIVEWIEPPFKVFWTGASSPAIDIFAQRNSGRSCLLQIFDKSVSPELGHQATRSTPERSVAENRNGNADHDAVCWGFLDARSALDRENP